MRMKETFLILGVSVNVEIQPVCRLIESQTCVESMCHWRRTTSTRCCFSLSFLLKRGWFHKTHHHIQLLTHTDVIMCVSPWTTERNKAFTENNLQRENDFLHWRRTMQDLSLFVPPSQGSSLSDFLWCFIIMKLIRALITAHYTLSSSSPFILHTVM